MIHFSLSNFQASNVQQLEKFIFNLNKEVAYKNAK